MKKIVLFFGLILISFFNLSAQILDPSVIQSSVITVENFLNHHDDQSLFSLISINKWDPKYHNGYSPECTKYALNIKGYPLLVDQDVSNDDNILIISISPDKKNIIIVIKYKNKYYGFNSELSRINSYYKIVSIPNELFEID
ncbi:MAG TPA: hypothetical protein PLG43_04000 [Spirochaetia bacterium]|nr:hypothetical protein [Spirochaetia bacterium]